MKNKELEKARKHRNYLLLQTPGYMKESEILSALQSGLKKVVEKAIAKGYSFEEIAEVINFMS